MNAYYSVTTQIMAITVLGLTAPMPRAVAASGGAGICPSYSVVVPGLEYAHLQMTNWNSGQPLSIHIARLDRARKDLSLTSTLAHGQVFGTAPVSAIARTFPKEQGEPLVAINAGFCIRIKHPYRGAPRGMVITDGELISSPGICIRNYSFWIDEGGAPHFGRFEPAFQATLPDGTSIPIGLNHECSSNAVVLFTHVLGRSTRATNNLELILEDPQRKPLAWRVGESYSLSVRAVNAAGDSALSRTTAVLSFGSQMSAKAAKLQPGDPIKVELGTSPRLKNATTACHVIFPIVEHGKPLEKFDASGAILRRNPRTAIGFNDRYFYMVVVDGRQKALSMGLNAQELAQFMYRLGCTEAVNLDGGGSSTFWMAGKTRNSVPGGVERDRSDALVIVRRRQG
jgi:hypothetical protein